VDILIDEVTEAALAAIEQAAGEAARAAILSMVEREAAAVREAQRLKVEMEIKEQTIKETRKTGIKNAVLAGVVCFIVGFAVGFGGGMAITHN